MPHRLIVPPSGQNVGSSMLRQAIECLRDRRAAGGSAAEMAADFVDYAKQINSADRGWNAPYFRCTDGSHAFVGAPQNALVISFDRRIFRGRAMLGPGELVNFTPILVHGINYISAPDFNRGVEL